MRYYLRSFLCIVLTFSMLFSPMTSSVTMAAVKKTTTTKNTAKTSKTTQNTKTGQGYFEWKISLNQSIKGSRIKKMKKYKILVIDAQNYSAKEIKALKDAGHKVYSYLNIGSVESNRWYYGKFKSLRLKTYANWEDEYWVDVSKQRWRDFIINKIAASMVKKGVDGFWVDNTDVYEYNKKKSIYDGLVKILTRLRKFKKGVVLNGGDQFITPLINRGKKHLIDGMVQEEVTTTITSYSGHGSFSSHGRYQKYYERFFKRVKKAGLSVGVLEYTRSSCKRASIRKYCKKHKFNYCIASDLII